MKQTLHELGSNKNIFSTWVDIQVFWNEINESLIIYFDCVNKTMLFMANSNQTIHRKWNCWSLTHVKMHNLFRVDENSLEQCCAAHIVQCCHSLVNNIVQYCYTWLQANSGSTMLNNIVDNIEQCGQHNIVQGCFHQPWTSCVFFAV